MQLNKAKDEKQQLLQDHEDGKMMNTDFHSAMKENQQKQSRSRGTLKDESRILCTDEVWKMCI